MPIKDLNKIHWPKIIYYKKSDGSLRNRGGKSIIAYIKNSLDAREVELQLSKRHNQIYKYDDEHTLAGYKNGNRLKMIALVRIDAPTR